MRLGNYIKVRTGKLDANAATENGKYPFFTCSEKISSIDNYAFDCECVLLAGNGELNAKYYDGKFNAYQRTYVIESLDKEKLSVKFLYYFFKHYLIFLRQDSIGGVIKYIKLGNINDANITIPTIEKQKYIIGVLESIENAILAKENQLALLDELIKSRFVELFMHSKYPLKRLDELSLSKGEYGASSASVEYDPRRPRYVRITDINDDGTLNDDKVCSKIVSDDKNYLLEYGDFLFARMGATVGKTYAFYSGNQIYAGYLIRYKLNLSKINPRYLYWFTRQNEYLSWIKLKQSGAAQPGINAKKYDSLQIPLPPIELQNEFALFVEKVDKLKFIIQQQIKDLQELLDKKMDEYFSE